VSDPVRHRAAVARTLSWAREAADRGDHADALAWLLTLDAIGYEFSQEDQRLRDAWRRILASRPVAHPVTAVNDGVGAPVA
jgi:hypothetical protein